MIEPESQRKNEEAAFHDRLRSLYETDPAQYARYTSNKKFYSIVQASNTFFLDWLKRNATGKKVLDFGCGSGSTSIEMAGFASHVTGIDISPESVRLAQEHAAAAGRTEKTTFLVMDAENLEFPAGSFDVVCVAGVLHHMDVRVALNQIRKVLTPEGKAIFLEALADNPLIHAYRRRTPQLRTAWETEHILHAGDARLMRGFFKNVEVRYFHLASLAAVPIRSTRAFKPTLSVLDAVDAAILRVPGLQRMAWMACFMLSSPIQVPESPISRP